MLPFKSFFGGIDDYELALSTLQIIEVTPGFGFPSKLYRPQQTMVNFIFTDNLMLYGKGGVQVSLVKP